MSTAEQLVDIEKRLEFLEDKVFGQKSKKVVKSATMRAGKGKGKPIVRKVECATSSHSSDLYNDDSDDDDDDDEPSPAEKRKNMQLFLEYLALNDLETAAFRQPVVGDQIGYWFNTGPDVCRISKEATNKEKRQGFSHQMKVMEPMTRKFPTTEYRPVLLTPQNFVFSHGRHHQNPGKWVMLVKREYEGRSDDIC